MKKNELDLPEQLNKVANLFKVFGDFTRVKILHCLQNKELNVGQICDIVELNTSAVSHQLRVLRQSELVKARKDGKEVYYSLADDHVLIMLNTALEHINE